MAEMESEVERAGPLVLNEQIASGACSLEEGYGRQRLARINRYRVMGVSGVAAARVVGIEADTRLRPVAAGYIQADCQSQRLQLRVTFPVQPTLKRPSIFARWSLDAKVD